MTKILEIQGLRAVAVILVILYHLQLFPGGFIGVDIFYVISGYLITNLIISEITDTGHLNILNFYKRRIKRLLPASAFVLLATALICYLLLPPMDRSELGKNLIAISLLVFNYALAAWENDYQNLGALPSPLIHYWSLAVEEQFYLIWPILLLALSKFGIKAIKNAIIFVFIISFTFSVIQTPSEPILSFYSLHTRAWELAAGALIVFLPKSYSITHRMAYKALSIAGVLLIGWASFIFTSDTAFPGHLAAIAVLGAFLLIITIGNWVGPFKTALNNQFTQRLGAISYPLYLWHWPLIAIPTLLLERELKANEKLLAVVFTIILSELTHRFIEQPFRFSKISLTKTYLSLAAATTISVVVGIFIMSNHSTNILVKEKSLTFDLKAVTALPIIHSDGCHVNWNSTISKDCSYGDLTSKKTIVLFGDSHAAQWFDPINSIAIMEGYKLISLTKSACPAIKLPIATRGSYNNNECRQWQSNSIERIKKITPDILIVSNFSHFNLKPKQESKEHYYLNSQQDLYQELEKYVGKLIYISDTPKPTKNIPRCLSHKTIDSCDEIIRSSGAVYKGFIKIDPYNWFCDATCLPVKEDLIVYRDASHISKDAANFVTKDLEKALKANKVFN